jgi:hypothetical protein
LFSVDMRASLPDHGHGFAFVTLVRSASEHDSSPVHPGTSEAVNQTRRVAPSIVIAQPTTPSSVHAEPAAMGVGAQPSVARVLVRQSRVSSYSVPVW